MHVDSLLYTLLSSGELSTCLPPAALAAAVTAEALVALSVRGPAVQAGGKGKPAVAVHSGAAAGAQAGQGSGSGAATTEGGQGAAVTAAAGAKAAAGGMKLGLTEMVRRDNGSGRGGKGLQKVRCKVGFGVSWAIPVPRRLKRASLVDPSKGCLCGVDSMRLRRSAVLGGM